jgi:hypothetical protein
MADPTESVASADSEYRPATRVSVTPNAITASWPISTVPAWRVIVFSSNKVQESVRATRRYTRTLSFRSVGRRTVAFSSHWSATTN